MTITVGEYEKISARARRSDPETSHEAARSISVKDLRSSQRAVLRTLAKLRKGGTDVDIAGAYDHYGYSAIAPQSPSGLRTRRAELVDRGLVADSGLRKRLPSGRQAIVWVKAKG